MEDASIVIAFWVETLLWISIVLGVLVARRWWTWARVFSGAMIRQWRPALVIAVLCMVCRALAGEGVTLDGPVVFCQALIGLALARSIVGYEPLPVTQAVVRREGAWRRVGMMLAVALALVPLPIVVSVLGGLGGHLLGETPLTGSSVANSFPPESWKVFLMMLAGGGDCRGDALSAGACFADPAVDAATVARDCIVRGPLWDIPSHPTRPVLSDLLAGSNHPIPD